jgi:hypothetical protein
MLLLVLLLGTSGCYSATYIQANVTGNPLDRVAQQAQQEWAVERVNANTLHLRDTWPILSVLSLGYDASHANLFYDAADSVLNIQYYFQSNQLLTLFTPIYLHAEPGAVGALLKSTMNEQINDILRWSGGSVGSRRVGEKSEPFPSKATTSSPPN